MKYRLFLIGILLIGNVLAYTPTYELCFDEDGRGYECYDGILYIDEYAIWERVLSEEQSEFLFNDGLGRILITDLCFENGLGYKCFSWSQNKELEEIIKSLQDKLFENELGTTGVRNR